MNEGTLTLGAVVYDPKVATIWEGFRRYLRDRGLEFDYILYSNYERQVEHFLAGHIDIAWNSPLAWIRAQRLAGAAGVPVRAMAMRDWDCDLTSVIVVPSESPIQGVADLRGRTLGTGAVDSPQATLIPLEHLEANGLVAGEDFTVRRHDILVGLHGDHVGGERHAAKAMVAGEVDAACMLDVNYKQFTQEGTIPEGSTRIVAQTAGYDHCNMTVLDGGPNEKAVLRFGELLFGMDYDDPEIRPVLDLEGMKEWLPGRLSGYEALERAVDTVGFYDAKGAVTADQYQP